MGQIYIPGTESPIDVGAGKIFSAGINYQATETVPDNRGATVNLPDTLLSNVSNNTVQFSLNDSAGLYDKYSVVNLALPGLEPQNIKAGVKIGSDDENMVGTLQQSAVEQSNLNATITIQSTTQLQGTITLTNTSITTITDLALKMLTGTVTTNMTDNARWFPAAFRSFSPVSTYNLGLFNNQGGQVTFAIVSAAVNGTSITVTFQFLANGGPSITYAGNGLTFQCMVRGLV